MKETGQGLQKSEPQGLARTLGQELRGPMLAEIKAALPRHIDAERFIRIILTSIRRVPKLQNCTMGSIMACIMQSAQEGLELDGVHAAMVPFKGEATYIRMYPGLLDLARRSGEISSVRVVVVREGDVFQYEEGLDPILKHIPGLDNESAAMVRCYAVFKFRDGGSQHTVMTKNEVDAIRARAPARNDGPWVTDYLEMAKKTVLRRGLKLCPTSADVRRIVAQDERDDLGIPTGSFDLPAPAAAVVLEVGKATPAPDVDPPKARVDEGGAAIPPADLPLAIPPLPRVCEICGNNKAGALVQDKSGGWNCADKAACAKRQPRESGED